MRNKKGGPYYDSTADLLPFPAPDEGAAQDDCGGMAGMGECSGTKEGTAGDGRRWSVADFEKAYPWARTFGTGRGGAQGLACDATGPRVPISVPCFFLFSMVY